MHSGVEEGGGGGEGEEEEEEEDFGSLNPSRQKFALWKWVKEEDESKKMKKKKKKWKRRKHSLDSTGYSMNSRKQATLESPKKNQNGSYSS